MINTVVLSLLCLVVAITCVDYVSITSTAVSSIDIETGAQKTIRKIESKPPPGTPESKWRINPVLVAKDEDDYQFRPLRGVVYTTLTDGKTSALLAYNYINDTILQGPFFTHDVTNIITRDNVNDNGAVFLLLRNGTLIKLDTKTLKEINSTSVIATTLHRVTNTGGVNSAYLKGRNYVRLSSTDTKLHDTMVYLNIYNYEEKNPDYPIIFGSFPFPHAPDMMHFNRAHPDCVNDNCLFAVTGDNFQQLRGPDAYLLPTRLSLKPTKDYKGSQDVLKPNAPAEKEFVIILTEIGTNNQYSVVVDLVHLQIQAAHKLESPIDPNYTVIFAKTYPVPSP